MVALVVAAAGAALAQGGAGPGAPYRPPYVPAADSDVLQKVPPARDPAVREMRRLQAQVVARPGDVRAADELARAYVAFGRRVGDAHYAGYAEAVLAPWMRMSPPAPAVLVTQAAILQYRHDFDAARALYAQAVTADPSLVQAWLSVATLDMVQGNYARAAQGCTQVSKQGGFALGIACAASLRLYTGEAGQGVALLARIDSDAPSLSPAFKAWVAGLEAEGAERLGQWDKAEAAYRRALVHAPGDNFLLVAYADLLLDRGRPRDAIDLLTDYADSDTAFLRLALAHAALSTPEAPRYAWVMTARFEGYAQRGSEYYGREQARFLLKLARDPAAALRAAQRNWETQREPWDARVLLEAALAAGQPRAAAPVVAFVEASKLQDPRIAALVRDVQAALRGRGGAS